MKKLICILLVALCLSLCVGCGGGKYIGKDKAREIALADAGFAKGDVRDLECELDKEVVGSTVYEVSFEVGLDDYEYDIDAVSGEILKSKVD